MTETTERPATPRPSEPGRRKARRHGSFLGSDWGRGLVIFVVVALIGAGVFYVGRALTTADPARLSLRVVTPAGGLMPQERFRVEGSATDSANRPIYLERQLRGAWSRVESAQTTNQGEFLFTDLRIRQDTRFRIVLPEISQLGQRHPEVTQVLPRVQVTPQNVAEFSVLHGIVQNGVTPAEAGVTPVCTLPGRTENSATFCGVTCIRGSTWVTSGCR